MKSFYTLDNTHKEIRGIERITYGSFSLILSIVLFLLPLAPVFADEVTETIEPSEPTEVLIAQDEDEEVVSEEEEDFESEDVLNIEESQVESEPLNEVEVVSESNNFLEEDESLLEVPSEEESVLEASQVLEEQITEETEQVEDVTLVDEIVPDENEEELIIEDVEEVVEEIIDDPTEDIESDEEVDETSFSSSTPEVAEDHVSTVINDENKFSFSEGECAPVGDSTFYCTKPKSNNETVVTSSDRVFSAPDAGGDKEIYVESGDELIQISSNDYEDAAPYYDEVSETIVWHRLIDGRYQIISYVIEDGVETQLTFDRYNNMSPNRFGDITIWQGWVGNDWEIFMMEGDDLTMITDNTVHDIAPSLNGTHIIWQSFEGGAWVMKVYDTKTKVTETVLGNEGGSIENPRFVLVYDTKYESGDVETRGYDLKTGEVLELAAVPVSLPEEIPDPEQTGEERALVAPTPQVKSKTVSDIDSEDDFDDDSSPEDVLVPVYDTSTSTDSSIVEEVDTISDEDIPVLDLSNMAQEEEEIAHEIEDLIITPFTEPIEAEDVDLDPQI